MAKVYNVIASEDNGFRYNPFDHMWSTKQSAFDAIRTLITGDVVDFELEDFDTDMKLSVESTGPGEFNGKIVALYLDSKKCSPEQAYTDFSACDSDNYMYDWFYIYEIEVK